VNAVDIEAIAAATKAEGKNFTIVFFSGQSISIVEQSPKLLGVIHG